MVFIDIPFLAAHGSGGNDAQFRVTDGESKVEQPPLVGASEGVVTLFVRAVPGVGQDQQRGVLEKLLRLAAVDAVFLCALECIALVPIETDNSGPIDHEAYVYAGDIQKSMSAQEGTEVVDALVHGNF